MKRIVLAVMMLVTLSTLGLTVSGSAAESAGTLRHLARSHGGGVTVGSFWTYYDLSDWPDSVGCEIFAFHADHLYSGTWGDDGSWKGSGKTVTITLPGGHLSGGTFKGALTGDGTFVGLLSAKGSSPSGPEELASGGDPFDIGSCEPPS
jgi:hypothetical protein